MEQVQRRLPVRRQTARTIRACRCRKRARKNIRASPGVEHTVGVSGESFLFRTIGSNLGLDVRRSQAVGRPSPGRIRCRSSAENPAALRQNIEGAVIGVFRAPPIRGLGNAGGFKLQTEQRGYVDLKELQSQTDQLVAEGQHRPAFRRRLHHLSCGHAATLRGHRPHQSRIAASADPGRLHHAASRHGSLYVNQFIKFGRTWQVNVQAAPRFRTNPDISTIPGAQQPGPDDAVGHGAGDQEQHGPVLVMRYNM